MAHGFAPGLTRTLSLGLIALYVVVAALLAASSLVGLWTFPSLLPQAWALNAWHQVGTSSSALGLSAGLGAVAALASLALTLTAYAPTIPFLPLEELGMKGGLDLVTCLKIVGLAAPFVLFGAALMVAIASFTKTYKEAQNYLTFVTLIPIVPLFMTMLGAPKVELWMVATPTLAQHLLVTQLLKGEAIPLLHYAVSIGTTTVLGLAPRPP